LHFGEIKTSRFFLALLNMENICDVCFFNTESAIEQIIHFNKHHLASKLAPSSKPLSAGSFEFFFKAFIRK